MLSKGDIIWARNASYAHAFWPAQIISIDTEQEPALLTIAFFHPKEKQTEQLSCKQSKVIPFEDSLAKENTPPSTLKAKQSQQLQQKSFGMQQLTQTSAFLGKAFGTWARCAQEELEKAFQVASHKHAERTKTITPNEDDDDDLPELFFSPKRAKNLVGAADNDSERTLCKSLFAEVMEKERQEAEEGRRLSECLASLTPKDAEVEEARDSSDLREGQCVFVDREKPARIVRVEGAGMYTLVLSSEQILHGIPRKRLTGSRESDFYRVALPAADAVKSGRRKVKTPFFKCESATTDEDAFARELVEKHSDHLHRLVLQVFIQQSEQEDDGPWGRHVIEWRMLQRTDCFTGQHGILTTKQYEAVSDYLLREWVPRRSTFTNERAQMRRFAQGVLLPELFILHLQQVRGLDSFAEAETLFFDSDVLVREMSLGIVEEICLERQILSVSQMNRK